MESLNSSSVQTNVRTVYAYDYVNVEMYGNI